jgi:chromosome segregation ATPase
MKTKVFIVVLVIIALGLCVGLISIKNDAAKQHDEDASKIALSSNQLTEVTAKWDEEKQNSLVLEKDIVARKDDISKLSNTLSQTSESLAKTQADLKSAMEESAKEMAKRDARITELESQNTALDKQAVDLKGSISNLEGQIADTQKKLDASEGDKAFLTKELNRLMAEKAELERQFNDLAVLRTQVKTLKEQLSVSRRLEWIRQGLFANQDEHGAQRLMSPNFRPASDKPRTVNTNTADLNVEVNSDGTVKVIAPLTTNTPPAPAK